METPTPPQNISNFYLVESKHDPSKHQYNPYNHDHALYLLDKCRDWAWDMLDHMYEIHRSFEKGETSLAKSPLRSKPWLAAALVTAGYIKEVTKPGRSCTLRLTEKSLAYYVNKNGDGK